METTTNSREQLSALADGELRGDAFAQALAQLAAEPQQRADWDSFHVVGEVLRSGHRMAQGADMAFVARVCSQLPAVASAIPVAAAAARHADAANQPIWRWKAVAGFASIAAVAALGWNLAVPAGQGGAQLAGLTPGATSQSAQPAQVGQPVQPVQPVQLAGGEPRQVMIRDARLDELMAAHKAGNASALQMPSGFLRNATFDGPAR